MFSRLQRFHGHNSLRPVYQTGKSLYAPHMKLLWLPASGLKVAVVVSKKVHKSAVVRNRIRRRLYEITRTYAKEQELACHIVCIVQSDVLATLPPQEVSVEMRQLLQKIK